MKKQIFVIILLATTLHQCTSSENKFQKAEEQRSQELFEEFINKYPESELVDSAMSRIAEIKFWEKIGSSFNSEPYEIYIDSFNNGLYLYEAQNLIMEIQDFIHTREMDIIDAYNSFSEKYSESIFMDSINDRINYLLPANNRFQSMKLDTTIIALQAFVVEFHNTGYGKLIQSHLDTILKDRRIEWGDEYFEIKDELFYVKGEYMPFSGIAFDLYDNGNLRSEFNYVKGIQHGVGKIYYENGNLEMEAMIVNGYVNGYEITYWENGNKKRERTIKNGKTTGLVRQWFENGELFQQYHVK